MSDPLKANVSLSRGERCALALVILVGGSLLFWWLRPAPSAPRQARGLIVIDLATYHPGAKITPVFTKKAFRIAFWNRPDAPAPIPVPAPASRPHRKDPLPPPSSAPPRVTPPAPSPPQNGLWLNPVERTYTYIFRGRLTCGDQPCTDAQVRIALESVRNPDLQKVIQPAGDGAYEVRIEISEIPHESVRWTLNFTGTGVRAKELQGQAILLDDPTVTIENPPIP